MSIASNAHAGWPHRRAGRLAVASGGLIVAAFVMMQIMVMLGQRGGDSFTDNFWLTGTAIAGVVGAAGAVAAGLISMLHDHERSAFVVGAFTIGVLVVLFVAGELVFPH